MESHGSRSDVVPHSSLFGRAESWGLGGLQGLKLEEFENLIDARDFLSKKPGKRWGILWRCLFFRPFRAWSSPFWGNQCQIYGNFEGFPEKNMVHEVWVGVILHDPPISMGPMGAKTRKRCFCLSKAIFNKWLTWEGILHFRYTPED